MISKSLPVSIMLVNPINMMLIGCYFNVSYYSNQHHSKTVLIKGDFTWV